VKDLNLRPTG